MIIYCGLSHFYIHHFEPTELDAYYILTHNKKIWDFSPALKDFGFNSQVEVQTIMQLDRPVLTIPINLDNFISYVQKWHDFSLNYTTELEVEYPHAWYLRFKDPIIAEQFSQDFESELLQNKFRGIWGGGPTKLIAKLAAHNFKKGTIIAADQVFEFLHKLPLHRLPLPEREKLEKLGLKTLGELADISPTELANHFGDRGPILQQLGRGEDLVPFQKVAVQEYSWELDCTTLTGYFRALTPDEIQPYIKKGLTKLTSQLQAQQKLTGEIILQGQLVDEDFKKQRILKEPTNELKAAMRLVNNLLPVAAIEKIIITFTKLKPASVQQLNMFWHERRQRPVRQIEYLNTQVGIELPRRERFLILWEEYFKGE